MRTIVLDGKKMTSPEAAHEYIAKEAGFPAYYGKNLDALNDCLGELGRNTCIVLLNRDDMRKQLGLYAGRLIRVFEDAAEQPFSFDFVICEDE